MPTPRTPDDMVKQVGQLWARLSLEAREGKRKEPSATAVWLAYHGLPAKAKTVSKGSRKISLRKVQQIVAEVKKKSDERSVSPPPVEWQVWENQQEGPESAAFLLLLDAISLAMYQRHPYQSEAKWAQRLRVALEGLTPYDQFCFVQQYAFRQDIADWMVQPLTTADLDGVLAYKPWLSTENERAYQFAVDSGSIRSPGLLHIEATLEYPDDLDNPELKDRFEAPPTQWWALFCQILAARPRHQEDQEKDPLSARLLGQVQEFWSRRSMFIPKELSEEEVAKRTLIEDRILELWSRGQMFIPKEEVTRGDLVEEGIQKEDEYERLNSQTQPN